MQHRIINKFTVSLVFALFAIGTASASADNAAVHQRYSLLLAGGQSNPWALPPAPEDASGFRHLPQGQNQPYPDNQADTQYPGFRFVTPEILESLKQQQMQNQQIQNQPGMYQQGPYQQEQGSYSNRQYRRPQPMMPRQNQSLPGSSFYGYPPMGGMGTSNPLYDVPASSPWSSPGGYGPDVMYQGQSFPWLPDAAIGGIPPISVPPLIGNNNGSETGNDTGHYDNNVFNPFTFGPNGNL